MKAKSSFATLDDYRCPVCGATQAKMISAARNSSFACSRCRTQLEVTAFFLSRSLRQAFFYLSF